MTLLATVMRPGLTIAIALSACSSTTSPTRFYAVGATDDHVGMSCTIADNAAGAVAVVPDHPASDGGTRLVFEAVKPGKARIACRDQASATIEVRLPARVAVRRDDGASGSVPVGMYAPTYCLVAFDASGTELAVGAWAPVEFEWSEHVTRVVDHGMGAAIGGPSRRSCSRESMADRPGTATISATWHGFLASAELEIRGL